MAAESALEPEVQLLPSYASRQQAQLARWRRLNQPLPRARVGPARSHTSLRASASHAPPKRADPEALELQMIASERRELMARQKEHSKEIGRRAQHIVQQLQREPVRLHAEMYEEEHEIPVCTPSPDQLYRQPRALTHDHTEELHPGGTGGSHHSHKRRSLSFGGSFGGRSSGSFSRYGNSGPRRSGWFTHNGYEQDGYDSRDNIGVDSYSLTRDWGGPDESDGNSAGSSTEAGDFSDGRLPESYGSGPRVRTVVPAPTRAPVILVLAAAQPSTMQPSRGHGRSGGITRRPSRGRRLQGCRVYSQMPWRVNATPSHRSTSGKPPPRPLRLQQLAHMRQRRHARTARL